MNTVIPEFVERVDARKGPYYGEIGNYGSAETPMWCSTRS